MNAGPSDVRPIRVQRRRWPLVLGGIAALLICAAMLATFLLQPARLTELILARASSKLHLELHTTGPGSYALRPEPRLVLPGLSASLPGENAPFFRSARVELALPWDTLRGRSIDINSIVLKSPDLDLSTLQRWLATLPPRTTPFQLPRLTRGLHVDDGTLRATHWRIEHLDVVLPSLADGKPMRLDARGDLLRDANVSKFAFGMAATPTGTASAEAGSGLRISDAHIVLDSDGELPSLTASGDMLAGDSFALDLAGIMQRVPARWSAMIDTNFAQASNTPFALELTGASLPPPTARNPATADPVQQIVLRKLMFGDQKHQPSLSLSGDASFGDALQLSLHGQFGRWPDAWPTLPQPLASGKTPVVIDIRYRGSRDLDAAFAIDLQRGNAKLQRQFRAAQIGSMLATKFDALLSPVKATFDATRIDIGGTSVPDAHAGIRNDAGTPTQQAAMPTVVPKS